MDNNQLEGTDPDDLALIASELELETELTLSLSPSVWFTNSYTDHDLNSLTRTTW